MQNLHWVFSKAAKDERRSVSVRHSDKVGLWREVSFHTPRESPMRRYATQISGNYGGGSLDALRRSSECQRSRSMLLQLRAGSVIRMQMSSMH